MEKAITVADASGKFSELVRAVREGQSYVVTSFGKPVARVVPFQRNVGIARSARAALIKRLRSQPVGRVGSWGREELYHDRP